MASVNERRKKDGTSTWQVHVRIPGQPKIIQTFNTRDEAEDFGRITEEKLRADQKKVEKANQTSTPNESFQNLTLRSVIKAFSTTPVCSKGGAVCIATISKLKFTSDTKIGDINKAWIRNYIAKLRDSKTRINTQYAWATIHRHIRTMNAAVRWQAEELDLIVPKLPFDIKRMFPKNWDNKRTRRLEPGEYVALMTRIRKIDSSSSVFWRYLIRLAIETGARQQELIFAEWREVDFKRGLWVIPAEHTKTKTERTVPLSMRAVRILKMLLTLKKSDSDQIFHFLKTPAVVSALFRRYIRDANIVNFRFHDLRHEAITRMVLYKRKLSPYEIMEIVGHSGPEMLRRYTNIRKDELVGRMD